MPDFKLSSGKEITIDLYKIDYQEWKGLFDKEESADSYDGKLARVGGLTLEEYQHMPYPDHVLYERTFWEKAKNPLADSKNSPSAPSSP